MNGVGRGDKQDKKEKNALLSRETLGMTLLLFSAVIFFIAVTGPYVFGDIGVAITSFFVGIAGFFVYPLLILSIYFSVVLVSGRKYFPARWIAKLVVLVAVVFLIVHTATAERFYGTGYGGYLSGCWSAASERTADGTGGGVLMGLVAYPVRALLSPAGAYVIYALALAAILFWIAMATPLRALVFRTQPRTRKGERDEESAPSAQPVPYEDIPAPARAAALPQQPYAQQPAAQPYVQQPYAQPQPYAQQPAAQPQPSENAYQRSRDILFHGDPASSYRNNLIFDRDSRFNTYPRRSSVTPVSPEDAPPQSAQPSAAPVPPRYSDAYTAKAEAERPSMPRRITVERPAPALEPADDLNYPQSPSYRAPAAPAAEEREDYAEEREDYYEHDVPPQFSSQPTVDDYIEAPAEPERPRYEAPAEPERPRYEAPAEPERPRYEAPAAPEPLREEPEEPAPMTREEFRSVFSRPVEERIRIEPPADDAPSRIEPRSAFPAEPSVPAPAEDSRVYPGIRSAADMFDDDENDADYRVPDGTAAVPAEPARTPRTSFERPLTDRVEEVRAPRRDDQEPAPVPQKHVYKAYVRPSLENLAEVKNQVSVSQEEIEQNSAIIVETLAGFRVDAEVVKVTVGSAVTRYDIDIPRNVTVSAVIKRDAEIAMRLHARDGVNIYSNSEAGAISIEVPNSSRATVSLKSVMMADEYVNAKPNSLVFAIGKDVEGRSVCGNIVKMKHLLVAGATGSGKSVCLNAMLISLICKYSPEDMRLILIDPKKVEFAVFDGLPHLMINEIIADAQKAISALNWAIKEMERRYTLFEKKTRGGMNVHNLDEYNAHLTEDEEKLPKIVIVVDELADLMSVAKKEIEDRIQRLAQKARAAGMHLVIATQRPSVDVITGVIKGNLPTRLAFRVIQEVDSRTILDESGAQKLLGLGDMLFRTEGMYNCLRVQGAFVGSDEVQKIVEDIKTHNEAYFDESVADFINREESGAVGIGGDAEDDGAPDPQYINALRIVVKLGQASISLIQRKCSVGYNHAGKIIEWMEMMGYISAFDGKAKARTVLLSKEDFESKYGDLD